MREFLRITQEAVYGTFNTPTATTSPYTTSAPQALISLPADNSFTVRKSINRLDLRSQGAYGRRVKPISRTYDVGGKLMTRVRPSQAGLIATLLGGLSTGNCPDLPSFTCDHGFMLEDGLCSPEITRYAGCKADGTLAVANTTDGMMMMADLTITAQSAALITVTDFPVPSAVALMSVDNETPFAFQDCLGALTIGGARTDFSSISFNFGNKIIPYRGETATISRLTWRSRDPSVTIANLYKSIQDRQDYENVTPKVVSFTFTEGASSVAFNLGAANLFDAPQDDLKLADGYFMQTITLQNFIDRTTGTDFTVTVAYTPGP